MTADHVSVIEVGPRDGLQSLAQEVPTATKISLVDALSDAAFRKIEVTSFVSPRWVPQLGDAAKVMAGIKRLPGTAYAVLVPNERGLDRAIESGCDEIAVFAAASEAFSQANLNCSIDESLARFLPILERARSIGIPVRGYLSTVIACPFDGPVPPHQVAQRVEQLLAMGCHEISLGDTIGAGTGKTLSALLDCLLATVSAERLAGHFHDTHGTAAELVRVSLQRGLRTFDGSVGGLGGCPYAPGATGNISTRLILDIVTEQGLRHGIDLDRLANAETIAINAMQRSG